jgi:hypothetical protein
MPIFSSTTTGSTNSSITLVTGTDVTDNGDEEVVGNTDSTIRNTELRTTYDAVCYNIIIIII